MRVETSYKNESTRLEMRVRGTGKEDRMTRVFRDSNLVCPGPLEKLAKTFKCNYKKGVFPYSFVTGETRGYEGDKPAYSYYTKCSEEEYNQIPQKG